MVTQFNEGPEITSSYGTHLRLLHELLHQNPCLFSRPSKILRVLDVVSKGILAQLAYAPNDDVVDSLFNGHTAAHFVDKLR